MNQWSSQDLGDLGSYIFIDLTTIRSWRVALTAPSLGIQATQRSNWYPKQVNQIIITN